MPRSDFAGDGAPMSSFDDTKVPVHTITVTNQVQVLAPGQYDVIGEKLQLLAGTAPGFHVVLKHERSGIKRLDTLTPHCPSAPEVVKRHRLARHVWAGVLAARCARLQDVLVAWMRGLCPSLDGQVVAIDGKNLRGSHDSGVNMAHLVSVWNTSAGVVLGQVRTVSKSNEITAIPALLDVLDVRGATITADAMGRQREIVVRIADKGAHYVIGLKNNQPTLAQAVEALFNAAGATGTLAHDATLDKDHGRIETRHCAVLQDLSALGDHVQAWPQLRSVVRVLSTREVVQSRAKGTKPDTERRYLAQGAAEFNCLVRSHWSIENQLHWALDVSFDEDACWVRTGDGAQNLAFLRRIALNLLKQDKTARASLANKRLCAGSNTDYLQTELGLMPS